ncbi:MAG: hypothetical protein HY611_03635 [Elusimicrobia bacterium]|nr:hypothetical protein [Elusimicrobiota bacterium]
MVLARFALALILTAFLGGNSFALPPYQRLFNAHYGFKPNCTACHDADNWDLTGYGKGFSKNGADLKAFPKLEELDLDEDGAKTLEEIKAKANPGDPRSTPKEPGLWLENIPPVHAPKKHLQALFPGSDRYELQEEKIEDKERARIEKILGAPLRDQDLYPTYFIAYKEDAPLGAALYTSSAKSDSYYLAGYYPSAAGRPSADRPARIAGLRFFSTHERAFKKAAYMDQFASKLPDQLDAVKPPSPALAEQSQEIVDEIRRGGLILRQFFQPFADKKAPPKKSEEKTP